MRLFKPDVDKLRARNDVDGLIKALDDTSAEVRIKAAYALGKIGDSRAVEPLIRALDDAAPEVRTGATYALGEIGDTRAVRHLRAS
ncbi:MAG: HEAT repeat domain-containing protein [Halobacteriota archaeon]